jgi:O-antigen/teichoic acid export membrane protein
MAATQWHARAAAGHDDRSYSLQEASNDAGSKGRRSLSMSTSSVALVAGKVFTMGLGFLFWLVAARFFGPSEVGIAAGAVSAVMLCTQLALLGLGSAIILQFPRHRERPALLLDNAFTTIGISSIAAAAVFLLFASAGLQELSVVASEPVFAAGFVCMSVLGTLGILLDQVSTALRRGDQVLLRAIVFGTATVVAVIAVAALSENRTSAAIFASCVMGALTAVLLGLFQLRRMLEGYRYRPRMHLATTRRLLAVGVPNHALTLTERAPGLILPILVTELVSAEANAAWYAAWMMAWVVYIVPIQVGMTLFAEAARKTAPLFDLVRHGVRLSLLLGVVGAVGFALVAQGVLAILGPSYASLGTTPLRILVLAVLPLTFVQVYYVVCRSTGRLGEATLVGLSSSTASIVLAAAAATRYGLVGIAVTWLAVQVAAGAWAVVRVARIAHAEDRKSAGRTAPAAQAVRTQPVAAPEGIRQ